MKNKDILIGTCNYNTVTSLCKEAQNRSRLITIIGYPGAGKTTALIEFQKNNPNVYFMRVEPSMTAKQFYSRLLNVLGIEGRNLGMNLHDLISVVCHKLNLDSSKKLLIIDEAGKFKPKFMEYLHELRDNTMETTGIILAGPEYFEDNMKAWRNKGIIGIPEFYRRINHWETLSSPSKDEISYFCKAYNVYDDAFIKELNHKCQNFAEITDAIDSYHIMKQKSA